MDINGDILGFDCIEILKFHGDILGFDGNKICLLTSIDRVYNFYIYIYI